MRNVFLAASVAALVAAIVWSLAYEPNQPQRLGGVASLSYNFASPEEANPEGEQETRVLERIEKDMAAMSPLTRTVRLYSSSGVYSKVPEIARRHGFSVTAGAWTGADETFTKSELDAAVTMANRNPNVRALVVGNETILREEYEVPELVKLLRETRRRVRVPVTTGETWDIWLKHPQLGNEVDYIAAHILPYWEGIPADHAAAYAFDRYEALREAFPGKKIVIAEFGWPSQGFNNKAANAGPGLQAEILTDFIAEANRRGVPYNVIEAFDQPWKDNEGSVGAYWGMFDASRQPKFSFEGLSRDHGYSTRAILAVGLGLAITIGAFALARRRPTFGHALAVAAAAQGLAAGVAMAALYPFENYLNTGSAIAWVIGFLLMVPLTAMTLIKVHEVAEVTLGRVPGRLIRRPLGNGEEGEAPKVSIHVPAYREDPDMLIETLDSLAALDYPDYEVLVIINNTPDEALWRPVEAHCARLGERFKFINLPKVDGFKAGALNTALQDMSEDAEIIALIDADYVVHPDWLKDLVPGFEDPQVAIIQAPQDHRDGHQSAFKRVMDSEYAGFFDIGMVQRNEDDAIVVHGTMLLLRRDAFEAVGGWGTDTITEDTELGLRLMRAGWRSLYTARRYGHGMLPDTFKAFQTQRERWAFGAVQIIRKHWRAMLPSNRELTAAQKFQFITGWSLWISDAFGVLAAYLNLMWVPMILFVGVLIPTLPFTMPILAMFAVNLLHAALLYGLRVKLPPRQIAGAALAAMSLQMTVARGVFKGFRGARLGFLRTDKGGIGAKSKPAPGRRKRPALVEGVTGMALLGGASALYLTNVYEMVVINVFAATLVVQSIPFLCAPALYGLEVLARRRPAPAPDLPRETPVPVLAEQREAA